MMVFLDRRPRSARWLEWKVAIFSVAAVLGLTGMGLKQSWMTGVAILLLFAGIGLRFLPSGDGSEEPTGADEDDG